MVDVARAILLRDEGCRKEWIVKWPSDMRRQGKAYRAYTYSDADHIMIETSALRRTVSPLVGRKITPAVRAAISRAEAAQQG